MEQMQMNMPDIYDAALYLRLSKDDMEEGGAKSESNSIANQRELLRSFVKSQPDIQIFDIYVDDGYSGGNFDRPEFKRMTTDIEAGKVNCVIVKDLSRFGREYIEAGRWIEKTYPALNVRFISVTDQFDSKTADFSEKSFVVPIKNFVNCSHTYRNPKNFLLCVFLISFCCPCHLSHLFPALCPVFRIKPSYDFHFLNHILITDMNFDLFVFINIDFIYSQCQQCAIQFFDFQ